MKTLTLSESFKEMISRNIQQSKICYYLSLADKFPLNIKGSGINYLTTRQGGLISYLPKDKELKLTDDGKWARDGRQEARASAIANVFSQRVLNRIENKDFEIFTNIIKGYECTSEFEIVRGYDIEQVYEENTTINAIQSSCMQKKTFEDSEGDHVSIVSLYIANPDRIELITFRDAGGMLIGRALKWLADCGSIVVDRVYGNEEITNKINDLCFVNGWYKKQFNNYQDKKKFIYQGEAVKKTFEITLKNTDVPCLPYMDCFSYFQPLNIGAILRNHAEIENIIYNTCSNTDGYFSDEGLRYCKMLDSSRYANEFEHSSFYECDIYKGDAILTNKGWIYDFHVQSLVKLLYKNRTYTDFQEIEIFKFREGNKANRSGLIECTNVRRIYGYRLPSGKIIENDNDSRTERYYVATHPITLKKIKVVKL